MTRDEVVVDQTSLKKSAVNEADILIAAVSPTVNPAMKIQKENIPREGAMTRRTWKARTTAAPVMRSSARAPAARCAWVTGS